MRVWRMALVAGLAAGFGGGWDDVAVAQGWYYSPYFGGPSSRRRGVRPQKRATRREASTEAADVPLPPPRPRFPGDAPEASKPTETVTAPAKPELAAPATAQPKPAAPEKPAAPPPAAPQKPATAQEAPKPEKPGTPPPATPQPAQTPPLPPEKPTELKQAAPTTPAKPGEPQKPAVAPSGARLGEAPGQPEDDATCPSRLKARNVAVEPISIGPQPDARCTVVQAVRLSGLTLPDGGKVDFPEHPTVACTTADSFSLFVRDLLVPLAKGTFGSPVTAVWTGPGLECRSRDHVLGAKLSAHGQGLAIDIAQFKLADGRMIEVGQAKDDKGQNFETAARNAACGYFHTVLGPGSDSYHRTHWHFDLEVRGAHGDSKYCK